MPSSNDIPQLVEKYIVKQERFYNRPLKSFNKFLLTDLGKYLQSALGDVSYVEPVASQTGTIVPSPAKGTKPTVALISEEIGHLTGGRYYAWFIGLALVQNGYDVTIYSNQKPLYYDSFKDYEKPKLELVKNKAQLEDLDVEADIYLSSPLLGNIAVTKLAHKYHKPSFVMVFDPSPAMKEYLGAGFKDWDRLIPLISASDVQVISLCDAMSAYMYDWLNKREDQVHSVYPCINSKELEKAEVRERSNYVLFISRLVKHKKFEDVVQAVKGTDMRLKVISSNDGINTKNLLKKMDMLDRVDFYYNISDQEKFEMIYEARALVSGSIFEGFGMWAAEAVACGTPLVCYDFPTLHEIQKASGVNNFYYAKWNDPEDLGKQLQKCLKEAKFGTRNHTFDFEAMVKRIGQVFAREPRIGVITIALNEEQYIGASLKAVIKHPNVKKVAVVEGAVNLFAHAASPEGLSIDTTNQAVLDVLKSKGGEKVTFERYGWALDKSELRNRALQLLGTDIDYVLVVDADEVWKSEDLDRLVKSFKENPHAGVFLFPFYHFWKQKDLIATGGQWNSQMFRCFKFENKKLRWKHHGAPVINERGEFINVTDGKVELPDVHVYHYGYLKDEQRIKDKLEFYKKRDTSLVVVNTWSGWKKGQPTQPTHGGGTTEPFTGTHPGEVKGII